MYLIQLKPQTVYTVCLRLFLILNKNVSNKRDIFKDKLTWKLEGLYHQ